jgi:hypothetical protein
MCNSSNLQSEPVETGRIIQELHVLSIGSTV